MKTAISENTARPPAVAIAQSGTRLFVSAIKILISLKIKYYLVEKITGK
jgi:hypothetical protein